MSGHGAITVAVIDSGVNVPHPHLPSVAGGFALDLQGQTHPDYTDRLGHGTAVAAAIHEKAPAAEIWAVKVFDDALATSVATLVRALDWASERGIRVVNLSLGTPNDFRKEELEPAVSRAMDRGTLIVSAFEHDGRLWYPGCLEGVIGVLLDWDHPRGTVTVARSTAGHRAVRASGYPRPIPGVPSRRNLHGISFAVANATGVIATLLAGRPDLSQASDVLQALPESLEGEDGR